jgi:DNA repair exonuclease SbcCD nuclease subunit
MKLAIINDTHFGIRNDSPYFLEQTLSYFETHFFPYLIENNIKTVLHLGDLFDRRKYINFHTLAQVRSRFFDKLKSLDIKIYITIGNHDTYFKNTNDLNSLTQLFSDEEHVNIIESPQILNFDDLCIGMLPWIAKENEKQCFDFIQSCSCPIIAGHFEIAGFQVMNGVVHPTGIKENVFNRFEMVLSGHFHLKQTSKNIHYLGTQYQLNFGDVNSKKGFHVLDTATRNLEFIHNPNDLFHLIKYKDETDEQVKLLDKLPSLLKNCYVKVIVSTKNKPFTFDKFIDALYATPVYELSIVEDYQDKQNETDIDIAEDTLSIINKEIDTLEKVKDKAKLKVIIKDLYMESLTL